MHHDSKENLLNSHQENNLILSNNNLYNQNNDNLIENYNNEYDFLNVSPKIVSFYMHDDDNIFIKHEFDKSIKKCNENDSNYRINVKNDLTENRSETNDSQDQNEQRNFSKSFDLISNNSEQNFLFNKNDLNKIQTNSLNSKNINVRTNKILYQNIQPPLLKANNMLRSISFSGISNNNNLNLKNCSTVKSLLKVKKSLSNSSSFDSESSEENENIELAIKYQTKKVIIFLIILFSVKKKIFID